MEIYDHDLEAIAAKSIINCHALGVDSILFDDTPGTRIRAFIAHANHTLWRNYGTLRTHPLSVALHSHHCDVVLKRIFGTIWNLKPVGALAGRHFRAYKYVSQITTGTGSFIRADPDNDMQARLADTEMIRPIKMKASEEHTMFVPHGERAAWWVYEGADDPNYNGLCYSDDDLERFDFAPLYKPMSVDYLRGLLGQLSIPVRDERLVGR